MITYFKELENLNGHYLDLINTRYCYNYTIDIKTLPLEFLKNIDVYLKK